MIALLCSIVISAIIFGLRIGWFSRSTSKSSSVITKSSWLNNPLRWLLFISIVTMLIWLIAGYWIKKTFSEERELIKPSRAGTHVVSTKPGKRYCFSLEESSTVKIPAVKKISGSPVKNWVDVTPKGFRPYAVVQTFADPATGLRDGQAILRIEGEPDIFWHIANVPEQCVLTDHKKRVLLSIYLMNPEEYHHVKGAWKVSWTID